MIDSSIKFLYGKFFENKLLKSTGDAFQQLVYQLLSELYPSFEKIETQGAIGDRKNDGYLRGQGIFYQVYGPKDLNTNATSQSTAITKMPGDFYLLKKHVDSGYWEEIKEYIFVFKSFRGSFPDVIEEMKKMGQDNPSVTFSICDIGDLLRKFSELSIEKMAIVADTFIPEPDFEMVSFEVMGDIIQHLVSVGSSQNIDYTKEPPNFEDKIIFNNIANFHAQNLRVASYKIDQLDDYLSSYSDKNIADLLCSIFKKLYSDAQLLHPDDSIMQFQYILSSCHKPNTPNVHLQTIETNSYIMMAKYFETCDIFEEPPKNKVVD